VSVTARTIVVAAVLSAVVVGSCAALLVTFVAPAPDAPPTRAVVPATPKNAPAPSSAKPVESAPAEAKAAAPDPAAPKIVREIAVRVVCDEEFRRRAQWKSDAALRTTYASRVFEREFGIRFRIVDIGEWTSNDDCPQLLQVLADLVRKVPPSGAAIVLGFTGQSRAKGAAADYVKYGQADFYGPAAVCRAERGVEPEGSDSRVLCHELGHVLGAWHVDDAKSVMCGAGVAVLRFDAVSREAIEIGREIELGAGVAALGAEREGRLLALYRRGHAASETAFSPAAAWDALGDRLADERPLRGADVVAAYVRAAALYEASDGATSKHALNCRIAASKWRAWVGDLPGAVAEAEKAARAAEASPSIEGTPGEAAEQLADVLQRSGATARAAEMRKRAADAKDKAAPKSKLPAAVTSPAIEVTRQITQDDARRHVAVAIWNDGGRTRVVTEVHAVALDGVHASPGDDDAFAKPAAGRLHVRVVPPAEAGAAWDPGSACDGETFEVASAVRGELRLTVADEIRGGASGAGPAVEIARVPIDGGKVSRFGLAVRAKSGDASRYELVVRLDAPGGASPKPAVVPLDGRTAGVVVRLRPDDPSWRFARTGFDDAPLRTWRWFPKVGESVTVTTGPGADDVFVAGRRVDAADSKNAAGWRVSMRFVPDAGK